MDEVDNNLNLRASRGDGVVEEESVIGCEQQLCNILATYARRTNEKSEQQLDITSAEETNKEKNSEQRLAEKRGRQDDEEIIEEDGFVTVRRGHKKANRQNSNSDKRNENNDEAGKAYVIVSITGKEILPKQFGMAKLLRSLNIENVRRIVYKNAFKVMTYFNNKEDASKLLSCEKLTDLGYRVQMTDQANLCYGILKQIDLEMEEKEILENVTCEYDVISIRRLRRQSDNGEWVDSETIRICFKGNTLPPYVYSYGCRFKVEPYTFPVSQCSVCWRFGHLSKSCPSKKQICPKCGNNHPNCETEKYICVNCKGPHMALFKKCPVFLKEKEIRNIMTENNCNYRKGLEIYLSTIKHKETKKLKNKSHHNIEETTQQSVTDSQDDSTQDSLHTSPQRSYRNVLITEALVHKEKEVYQMEVEDCQQKHTQAKRVDQNMDQERMSQEVNTSTKHPRQQSKNLEDCCNSRQTPNLHKEKDPGSEELKKTFSVYNIFNRIREVCLSDGNWFAKFKKLVKYFIEICGQWFCKVLSVDNLWKNVVSMFNDG